MGASPSKEELLYQEVQNGNHDAVKSLRRDGASLEWVDKEGRTPLLLACSRGELLDMTITLLNLGANLTAYCPGGHGGYPLHYAAKRGLDKTVTLLLSHGANPLAVNDDDQTPLDMARSRGHAAVVRLLEEQLCLFSGTLRELSGPGILESWASNLLTRKVWAVVLPQRPCRGGEAPEYELAIYEPPKLSLWNGLRASSAHPAGICNVAQPRTVIPLAKAELDEPDFSLVDPVLCMWDKAHKTKIKLFSQKRGDKDELKKLYRACKGMCEGQIETPDAHGHREQSTEDSKLRNKKQPHVNTVTSSQCNLSPFMQPILQSVSAPSCGRFTSGSSNRSSMAESISEELALALALNESIRTATAESISVFPDSPSACLNKDRQRNPSSNACNGWTFQEPYGHYKGKMIGSRGHMAVKSASQRWTSSSTKFLTRSFREVCDVQLPVASSNAFPSAPPLPDKAQSHHSSSDTDRKAKCVICWDAPVEGACVPCGHLAGCMDCVTKIYSKGFGCPVCRSSIEQIIKVYTV
ncbi:hypothetical protein GOP47_0024879 [Adiantum capillus-veneris]|uniref:RING-type domain-containing protein n=1 Tax=Adiantum capillus-veneris TaxID=13818 RepID=A0A9D4Z417_ADICA|nr:hypothetical protein GOP47_0024879 [Adiantum capillus-veneris]